MEEQVFFKEISFFASKICYKYPKISELNYNAILTSKSMLLEHKLNREKPQRMMKEISDNLIRKRKLLVKLESEGSSDQLKIMHLKSDIFSLDSFLARNWLEYSTEKEHLTIRFEQVRKALWENEVAIEYDRYFDKIDSVFRYQALIINKANKYPLIVTLCNEKQLVQYKSNFGVLHNLIWQPLLPHLEGIKTVYYAPDGLIANIPIHALYESNDTASLNIQLPQTLTTASRGVKYDEPTQKFKKEVTYVMDRFELHQLTSTRYLALGLKEQAKQPINPSLVGFGGLDYDYLPNSPKAQVDKSSWASRMLSKKSIAMRSSGHADNKLLYLPGTQKEIQDITNTAASSGWKVDYFMGGEGTEKRISDLEGSQSPGVLHIASHGYAFPEYSEKDTTLKKQSLRYTFRYSKNPMVRSGLIMTGGNWAWLGSDTLKKLQLDEDGILTALEVSQLNLLHTKLVVLSACETGLGAIDPTEGVFGLKRAFKLAGAESLVLSLWSVPDDKTQELMGLFYQELTRSKLPVPSFAMAQKTMRDRYPTDPISWAGFVLVR
jgi:CHAT domain-containing protein